MATVELKNINKIYDNNVQAVLISISKSKTVNLLFWLSVGLRKDNNPTDDCRFGRNHQRPIVD